MLQNQEISKKEKYNLDKFPKQFQASEFINFIF